MKTIDLFDLAVEKLLEQGEKCMTAGGACLYVGADGMGCFVGNLIPEHLREKVSTWEHSHLKMETGLYALIEEFPELKELFGEHQEALSAGQIIHDRKKPSEWEQLYAELRRELFDE